jgi:hypothetical protein
MDNMQLPPEILEHARGTMTFDNHDPQHSIAGVAAYVCKIYRARLDLSSASQHAKLSFVENRNHKPVWGHC